MSKDAKEFCACIIIFTLGMVALFLWEASWQKPDNTPHYDEPLFTPTPTATVMVLPTQTPTCTPTRTVKDDYTPTPTNSPTPTVTALNGREIASYEEGKPGRYAAEVNGKHGFKPFTSYTCYNAKSTPQYRLQQIAFNCINGIRMVTDSNGVNRYCIALGTSWAGGTPSDIGRCVDIVMANGVLLPCVLADVKQVEDTVGCFGFYGATNNDCLEFIVNQRMFQEFTHGSWDCSDAGAEFRGDVAEVIVLNLYITGFGKE